MMATSNKLTLIEQLLWYHCAPIRMQCGFALEFITLTLVKAVGVPLHAYGFTLLDLSQCGVFKFVGNSILIAGLLLLEFS